MSLAHTDTNRKFATEHHAKVKQFDKEDILNRFKRADSTTSYVAILFGCLFFLSASTILKNFVAARSQHTSTENVFFKFTLYDYEILYV